MSAPPTDTSPLKLQHVRNKNNMDFSNRSYNIKYIQSLQPSLSQVVEILRMTGFDKTQCHELQMVLKLRDISCHKLEILNSLEIQEMAMWYNKFVALGVIPANLFQLVYPPPTKCLKALNCYVCAEWITGLYLMKKIDCFKAYKWMRNLDGKIANDLVYVTDKRNVRGAAGTQNLKEGSTILVSEQSLNGTPQATNENDWVGIYVRKENDEIVYIYEDEFDLLLGAATQSLKLAFLHSEATFDDNNDSFLNAINLVQSIIGN